MRRLKKKQNIKGGGEKTLLQLLCIALIHYICLSAGLAGFGWEAAMPSVYIEM